MSLLWYMFDPWLGNFHIQQVWLKKKKKKKKKKMVYLVNGMLLKNKKEQIIDARNNLDESQTQGWVKEVDTRESSSICMNFENKQTWSAIWKAG